MLSQTFSYSAVVVMACVSLGGADFAHGDGPDTVKFDLAPVSVAYTVAAPQSVFLPKGYRWVECRLDISALIDSHSGPAPQEFIYRIGSQSPLARVVDYSPQTQLADTAVGGIRVEQSSEKTRSMGLDVKGSYMGLLHLDSGANAGNKRCDKTSFERVAPQEIVYASGTIDRGRGVYFKLRPTPTHVLDGRKQFTVTMQVPENWRGDLLDIRIQVVRPQRSLTHWQRPSVSHDQSRFQVAVYDQSDAVAHREAWQLAETEQRLRRLADLHNGRTGQRFLPSIMQHVADALDGNSPKLDEQWLQRSLFDSVDPYFDKQIRGLPVDVKVALLDYLDSKENFVSLVQSRREPASNPQVANLPALSQEAHSNLVAK